MVVPQPRKKGIARAVEYSSLAMMLPVSTGVGIVIGYYLDKFFGTKPVLLIVFLILGSVAGFVELIRKITRDAEEDSRDDGS